MLPIEQVRSCRGTNGRVVGRCEFVRQPLLEPRVRARLRLNTAALPGVDGAPNEAGSFC